MSNAAAATTSIDYTYRYAFPSGADDRGLRLATSGGIAESPHFFEGRLRRPGETGRLLLVLSDVVRTHFFLPRPPNSDPVVTSSEQMLRLEGFSGCCGVYARVDLPPEAFDRDPHHSPHLAGRGTTNVDFNAPMRAALARLRDGEDARLVVGADAVTLERVGHGSIVEKKVKLPVRWINGFCETAAYQPLLEPRLDVNGAEARRFVRSLPATPPKRPGYVVPSGRSLRLSQREAKGAVPIHGTHRLRVIEPLLAGATRLRAWADDASGTTAWQVTGEAGSLFLLLSPSVQRGFSGEGRALSRLAMGDGRRRGGEAEKANATSEEAEAALAVLGSRGLVGYDAAAGAYFHRELPFDLSQIEQLQPRLLAARNLVAEGKARLLGSEGDVTEVEVDGSGGVRHHVRLLAGDDAGGDANHDKCTCPWFSKYRGGRGPCKHVLAGRILIDGEDEA